MPESVPRDGLESAGSTLGALIAFPERFQVVVNNVVIAVIIILLNSRVVAMLLRGHFQSAVDDNSMMDVPNLLVTDDDKAFRKVVCEGLLRRGFRVIEACDGREALDLIEHSRVHVALVDVHMPHVTGLDVIRHLHESPTTLPCVLMSAELNDEIRQEAKKMCAYDVLSKPVRLSQLTSVVSHALTEYYGWQPPKAG